MHVDHCSFTHVHYEFLYVLLDLLPVINVGDEFLQQVQHIDNAYQKSLLVHSAYVLDKVTAKYIMPCHEIKVELVQSERVMQELAKCNNLPVAV